MLIDSHCHIHDADYPLDTKQVIDLAVENNITKMIVIGTDEKSSLEALKFAQNHEQIHCSIGVHPHHAKDGIGFIKQIDWTDENIVAIGEIGLDYHYDFSPRKVQQQIFAKQIELALANDLPIVFHIREAYDDFWQVVDKYDIKNAVVHSFSDNLTNLNRALAKGWYIGVNGIATFTKDKDQIEAYKNIPLDKIILETDSPYLAPKNKRGQVNQPAFVKDVAEFLAELYQIEFDELAKITTNNTQKLFGI